MFSLLAARATSAGPSNLASDKLQENVHRKEGRKEALNHPAKLSVEMQEEAEEAEEGRSERGRRSKGFSFALSHV